MTVNSTVNSTKMYKLWSTIILTQLTFFISCATSGGILYPRESESREVKSLDGIWSFRLDGQGLDGEFEADTGFRKKWFQSPLTQTGDVELMPVPSSFNDITEKKAIRDHIGWVWYETTFFTPRRWMEDLQRVFIRFGSANYLAVVWLNGEHLLNHTGGHLPFKAEVSDLVNYGSKNLLVVALNNTLTSTTIPQGQLHQPTDRSRYPPGFTSQTYNFDYFHFAGIHRPVYIYTTPKFYIDDITVTTDYLNNSQLIGVVNFAVDVGNELNDNSINSGELNCIVNVMDKFGVKVGSSHECVSTIEILSPNLWWPYLSGPPNEASGYLYTLEVHLRSNEVSDEEDVYRLPFGIRTVLTTNSSFLINGRPFYFRGFGRHEDYSIRGRGVDLALLVKDHNLIQWTGANSYRTSHYPYAEEILDLTDRLGIVIIDESPAIGLRGFGDKTLLKNHLAVMQELVQRDKNRASVLVWSLGNEPVSLENGSKEYFDAVLSETRMADPMKRPITIVIAEGFYQDKAPALDMFCVNRYFGWYGDTGRTEVIQLQIPTDIKSWYKLYGKPILISEYGAGTVAGMHMNPSFVWTEDYQVDYHLEHFKAFDFLRQTTPYFIGEMIWNFADFATPQETNRPWGCMKGVFTRERQPKRVAHVVRRRYWELANVTSGHPLPSDLI